VAAGELKGVRMPTNALGMSFLEPAEVRTWNDRARLLRAAAELRAVAEDTEARLDLLTRRRVRKLALVTQALAEQIGHELGLMQE
jgi:hypothetical protein